MSDKTAEAAFLVAAERGDGEGLIDGLQQKVDVNHRNHQGRSAIILASLNKHYHCVSLLIGAGADINQQDQTCLNPFLISCLNNDVTLFRMLLPASPDLTRLTRFGGVGLTPACEKGHVEMVDALLSDTAINVNHTNYLGWTPLLEAIVLNDGGERQQQIVRLLLKHGADPQLTDKYGKTPLFLAQEKGFQQIARLLIAAGG
ncbi:hypothetical protein BL250_10755 [Erwinia sp. OLTSP20]|uniref:ankyrin repeat domain-containing protein n=1 Tax=unclassified Erwinia TaxID=2622719 RepID=UPI000C194085|nr:MULTISPECIES: ankyrin repeat domain-containing protein [unclassified Erwinia]PIJ50158.1 hypothetical protein BV501_09985 [Erwinia sp. OAMSP11]PIJ71924.1 hypothetical protein BK416_11065 [Erwinia sp. OLSSP12]PIJ81126.1 hypothetical protein BLD47_09925 [Erwinia sp. OLCASP19]PIJ83556.1 hypothetical protein BLD46_09715 [Erwinia sp. OLMTSP26]PIJ86171.1 hypothetical protein BLD49_09040 [Erwinia sp. OLMDSP33]